MDKQKLAREVERLFNIIEKHGEGTSESSIYWQSSDGEPDSLKKDLAIYIKQLLKRAQNDTQNNY